MGALRGALRGKGPYASLGAWSLSSGKFALPYSSRVFPMVKPLAFKGEKKSKKRKAPHPDASSAFDSDSKELVVQNITAEGGEDDSWVTAEASTDVTGPIIFALPSAKPTCIACDANGKVFASELENIIEGDLATAEPHDVRQVFIANRVAGSDEISFKGHHGRYIDFNSNNAIPS